MKQIEFRLEDKEMIKMALKIIFNQVASRIQNLVVAMIKLIS